FVDCAVMEAVVDNGLWNDAHAILPHETQRAELGREPIARVADIAPVELDDHDTIVERRAKHPAVSASADTLHGEYRAAKALATDRADVRSGRRRNRHEAPARIRTGTSARTWEKTTRGTPLRDRR